MPRGGRVLGGRYRIEAEIGRGGCAVVHRAVDTRDGSLVAVKVLQAGESGTARFEREVELMSRLAHPHLVRVHAFDVDEVPPWMAMDLADGTLKDLAARGPVPVVQAARFALQTLAVLGFAHEAGVIHRDVKPTNLLLQDGAVKLADFGIARTWASRHTAAGAALGSGSFMAPEQQVDARKVRPMADIFGLGTTLYAVLSRKNPAALYLVPNEGPRWDAVPAPIRPVLFRATRGNPSERYMTTTQMAEAILTALADEPGGQALPAVWERASRPGS